MGIRWVGVVALLLSIPALALDPPGTPQPAMGAPGDKPGRGDPFGSQGGKVEEVRSQAEEVAKKEQPKIVEVRIDGNARTTNDHVKNHVLLHVGDELDEDLVSLSRVRLLQLGPFEEVHASVHHLNEKEVRLVFTVKERNNIFITDALYGSTRSTPFYGALGIAVADAFNSGLSFSATGLFGGKDRHAAKVSVYAPDLNIKDISFVAGGQAVYQVNLENACGAVECMDARQYLHYSRVGGEGDFGFRVGQYQRFIFGYRYEHLNAWGSPGVAEEAGPYILRGNSRISALVFSFDRDARDESFLPTKGNRVQLGVTLSSKAFASSYEYSRYLLQLEQWIPQSGGRAFRVDVVGGLVHGDAPFFERFYAADWSYFALGAATARLLNMNFSPDARYDMALLSGGVEYDFPLWRANNFFLKRGYLALGTRAVYSAATPGGPRTALSALPVSWDASLRVDTPVGVVGFSLGYLADLIF